MELCDQILSFLDSVEIIHRYSLPGTRKPKSKNKKKKKKGKTSPPVMKKLKICCIHGLGQDGEIFRKKTGGFRRLFKSVADFDFITSPRFVDEENPDMGRRWYHWEKISCLDPYTHKYFHVEDNMKFLCENAGDYDGVFAFSQGGCISIMLSALLQNPEHSSIPKSYLDKVRWRFMFTAGSFPPSDPEWCKLLKEPIEMPLFLLYGEDDTIIPPERSLNLKRHFSDFTSLSHPGGHFIPSTAKLRDEIMPWFKRFQT